MYNDVKYSRTVNERLTLSEIYFLHEKIKYRFGEDRVESDEIHRFCLRYIARA